ncbi:MAG: prepilin-type N-terminal cleavage/methylation domain-containing protein [Phycisphaerae bacterium]|nr:prepilin-type N-terminal cleavage/methylation domain-containing protein [Phycisphaerae bacterium]
MPQKITKIAMKRAFTLIEMMLAASVTALTATAGATMIYAISSSATQTRDYRTQRSEGHYALSMIGRTIRQARAIGYLNGDSMSLWLRDSNGNDTVDIEEMGRIYFDSSNHAVLFDYFDNSEVTGLGALAFNQLFTPSDVATVMNVTQRKTVALAKGVDSLQFDGHPDSVEVRMVQMRLTMSVNGESLTFHHAASPKASGDYLFFRETSVPVSDTSTRVLRKKKTAWDGFSYLGTLTPAGSKTPTK